MLFEKIGLTRKVLFYIVAAVSFHIALLFIAPSQPLQGPHKIRQADTLFSSFSYCKENTDFLKPRIMHREATTGVAIGEFPIYNYLMAVPCKVSGIWSASLIRGIDFVIYVLNFFLLGMTLTKAWGKVRWDYLTLFWFFTPLWFVYGTMPIPDGFTLTLFLVAWNWSLRTNKKLPELLQNLVLILVFLIRPYFFPLFLLVRPKLKPFIILTGLCGLSYLIWFKWWVPQATEVPYYSTSIKPIGDLIENLGRVLHAFIEQTLYHHLNYIGLILFVTAAAKEKKLFFCWGFSWFFILAVKADHFVDHPYYLTSAALISLLVMLKSDLLEKLPSKYSKVFAALYIALCITAIQHHYFKPRDWIFDAGAAVEKETQLSEKIAVYGGNPIVYLYSALRTGWPLPYDRFHNGENCPEGATWAWQIDENTKTSLLVKCTGWENPQITK